MRRTRRRPHLRHHRGHHHPLPPHHPHQGLHRPHLGLRRFSRYWDLKRLPRLPLHLIRQKMKSFHTMQPANFVEP